MEEKDGKPKSELAKGEQSSVEPGDQTPEASVDKLMENMPGSVKRAMGMMMSISGPLPHPLMEKITPEHVSKIIESGDKENERAFQEQREGRHQNLIIFIITVVGLLALIVFLVIMKENGLLLNLVIAILGFAGGIGVGKYYRKD